LRKLSASIHKEFLLLIRDKTGLFLLFVMPAFLVLIITLIQENVLKTDINVLFLDYDKGKVGSDIEFLLDQSDSITLIKQIQGSGFTWEEANSAVARGDFQFCIIIPKGVTPSLEKKSKYQVRRNLFPDDPEVISPENPIPEISVFYDPTIQGSFRIAMSSIIERVVRGIEQKLTFQHTLLLLPEKIRSALPLEIQGYLPENDDLNFIKTSDSEFPDILKIKETFATKMGFIKKPTSVQQNVPAWTLFGIFFIVVPLSGSLIRERDTGTMMKLKSMPVSYATLMLGKIVAYIIVCFGQFAVILFIGKLILPLFGSTPFEMGDRPFVFLLVLLSSICAATGYGIMLGTVLKSYEQASMFGPVSIVIAAAIGGILVPVYTMPDFMQSISLLSPLSWGQNAFYDILLRGGNLTSVLPEIMSLFIFFISTLLVSWFFIFRKEMNLFR